MAVIKCVTVIKKNIFFFAGPVIIYYYLSIYIRTIPAKFLVSERRLVGKGRVQKLNDGPELRIQSQKLRFVAKFTAKKKSCLCLKRV